MAEDTITTVMELDLSPYRKALEKMPKDAQKALKELERTAFSSAKKLASAQEKLSKHTASTVSKHALNIAVYVISWATSPKSVMVYLSASSWMNPLAITATMAVFKIHVISSVPLATVSLCTLNNAVRSTVLS